MGSQTGQKARQLILSIMQTTLNITLNRILTTIAERHASDLHLTVGSRPMVRLNEELVEMSDEEVVTQDFVEGVLEHIFTEEQKSVFSSQREIIFAFDFGARARFRVDVFMQRGYPSIVFHYIPVQVKPLSELGFPHSVERLASERSGLVIVGGPYRGGKTTTLTGFLETINRTQRRHILTLEQPVEHLLISNKSLIEQKEIGYDSESWLEALEIREEDVDVLMVTRVNSPRIMYRLIEIANSGILVFLPIEGNSIGQVLHSVIDNCPEETREYCRYLLSKVFRGAIIQKLLPKIGGGMVLAMEIVFASTVISSSIKENKLSQLASILLSSREQGMISMDRYLAELVKSGQVDKEVALRESNDPDNLSRIIRL